LPRLAEVNLSFNFFRHIPFILADCKSLENIIMAGNRIIELPPWLAQLPRSAPRGRSPLRLPNQDGEKMQQQS